MDYYSGVFVHVSWDDRPLTVRAREALTESPDVAVMLGEAPDGQPLVLSVKRPGSVERAVLSALGNPAVEHLSPGIDTALAALEAAVRERGKSIGVQELDLGAVYRSATQVANLLGDTLLVRTLGAQSPLILPDDRFAPSSGAQQVANTAVFAQLDKPITVMTQLHRKKYLTVPTRSGPVFVAELGDEHEAVRADVLQPLLFEDLRPLQSARFVAATGAVQEQGPLADEVAYRRALRQADRIGWTVARRDVARSIAGLARDLTAFHDEGRVHCDVKPGNALLTSRGPTAIDPLGVATGELSPGATPGWAAPEQVLARPVSPATDVYALGLMVASLVGGAIYGEERSFVIPTGAGGRRRLRVLASPDVFIDPSTDAVPAATRLAWCDFIRRCVGFEPERRPASAAFFAAELDSLLDAADLTGDLPVRGGPGALRRNVEVLGAITASWVIDDSY